MKKFMIYSLLLTVFVYTTVLAVEPEIKEMRDSPRSIERWRAEQYMRSKDFDRRREHQKAHEIRQYADQVSERAKFAADLGADLADK